MYDPKFVCVEITNGVIFESVSSGCCGFDIAPVQVPEKSHQHNHPECGDCEDLALDLTVTIQRSTVKKYTCADYDSKFAHFDFDPISRIVSHEFDGVSEYSHSFDYPHLPRHLCSGAAPLIC